MMKKILITSDTHRRDGNLLEVIQNEAPFDMFIHLGDAEGSEDMITSWCKEQNPDCEVYMVLGNNDFFSHLDREKEISIGKYRTFLTHGHFYSVSVGTERLIDEAQDRGDPEIFGGEWFRDLVWTSPQAVSGAARGSDCVESGQSFVSAPGGQTPELHAHGSG